MAFASLQVPALSSFKDVSRFLNELGQRLREGFTANDTLQLQELHVAPAKPSHGKLYFADGTNWNPGSGRGVYLYDLSTLSWRFLG